MFTKSTVKICAIMLLGFMHATNNASPIQAPEILYTQLMDSIKSNDITKIDALLKAGVNPNPSSNTITQSPLALSVCKKRTEIVSLLLEAGADPNTRDCVDTLPIFIAIRVETTKLLSMLIEAGAETDILDKTNNPPIVHIIFKGNEKLLHTFLRTGANANTLDASGQSALRIAARWNQVKITKILLQRGARPLNQQELDKLPLEQSTQIQTMQDDITKKRRTALAQFSQKMTSKELNIQPGVIPYLESIIHDFADTPMQQRSVYT